MSEPTGGQPDARETLVRVDGVSKRFGITQALADVSVALYEAELAVLLSH